MTTYEQANEETAKRLLGERASRPKPAPPLLGPSGPSGEVNAEIDAITAKSRRRKRLIETLELCVSLTLSYCVFELGCRMVATSKRVDALERQVESLITAPNQGKRL